MRRTTRDRLVLPVLLPVGILVVMVAILYGFSRILLSVRSEAATATALVAALGILVVGAVVTSRGPVRASSVAAMLGAVAGIAMLAGGIAVAVVGPKGAPSEQGPPKTVVALVAKAIAFQQTSLTVPAGERFGIAFDNQDQGIQHNVVIYDNPGHSGTPLFRGDLITGVAKATYVVSPLDAGTYYFVCQIHANMTGQIVAVAGGGGLTVTAQSLKFDTDTIELIAGVPSSITFVNKDAGTAHNLSFYTSDPLKDPSAENLFKGDLVTGPATVTYQIPPLEAGTYYFRCDVHPAMNGTLVVKEGGGGTPGATPTGSAGATPTATASATSGASASPGAGPTTGG